MFITDIKSIIYLCLLFSLKNIAFGEAGFVEILLVPISIKKEDIPVFLLTPYSAHTLCHL